ncbi:hypothetical protein ACEWPL_011350 [Roseovarius sp. S1116L3]|uniref:hypothetical protein n=1 Tax=Roseovarius roseus TaxID=3342636 RepID=UPI003729E3A0
MADKKGSEDSPRADTGSNKAAKPTDTKATDATPTGPKPGPPSADSAASSGSSAEKAADKGKEKPGSNSAPKTSKTAAKSGAKSAPAKSSAPQTTAKSSSASAASKGSSAASSTKDTAPKAADTNEPAKAADSTSENTSSKSGATTATSVPKTQTSKLSAGGGTSSAKSDDKPSDDKPSTTAQAGQTPASDTKPATATTGSGAPRTAEKPQATPPARRSGFLGIFLGGVCAAALGFGAAYYLLPQMGLMTPVGAGSDQAARIDEQAQRIDALASQVAALPGTPDAPDLSGIEGSQQALEGSLGGLSEQIAELTARLDAVENQPAGDGNGVSSGQLNALRSTIEQQGEQLAALTQEAEERDNAARAAAQQALRRAALTRIRTALDTGSEFASALGDLERAGLPTPDALQEVAETGVATQPDLQEAFAPAARAALTAARRDGADGAADGVWSFMSDQLGARSLERKEGPGTDAILSRAEDDLRQGNLQSALSEIETLPEIARAELSDWTAELRARIEALDAYDALAAKLN